jgi:hypothetical protein
MFVASPIACSLDSSLVELILSASSVSLLMHSYFKSV